MEQIDIFAEIERTKAEDKLKTECKLTTRQFALYNVFKATAGRKLSDKELLEMLPDYCYAEEMAQCPDREFNNTSAVRELRKDKKAIRKEPTIQKILVNGKLANTTEEAAKFLRKKKIKALKLLKEYWTEIAKLALDGQMRLQFNKERDHIEALLTIEEDYERESK